MDGSNDTAVVECCRRGNYHEFTELTARKSFVLLWALPGGKGYVWVSFDLPMFIVQSTAVRKERIRTNFRRPPREASGYRSSALGDVYVCMVQYHAHLEERF